MKRKVSHYISRSFTAATVLAGVATIGGGDLLAQTTPGPQPNICSRGCWNARAGSASEMSGLNRAVIHHTAGTGDYNVSNQSQSAARVRAIQNLHMDSNGWADIGYHFLVDKLGNVFEGRVRSANTSQRPRGSHDSNNTDSFGFNVMGYYHPPYSQSFTTASRNALWDVIAWRMPNGWSPYGSGSYNGHTVGRVAGHRNVKSTACPGDGVYAVIGTNYSGGEARNGIATRRNGGIAENAAMTTDGNGRVWFAQTQNDGFVYTRYFDTSISPPWGSVIKHAALPNVSLRAGPAIVGHDNGDVRLFAVTTNGKLHHRVWSASTGSWGSFSELGANDWSVDTAPVAVLQTSGQVAMAGVKDDGALITRVWSPSTGSWGGATEHGLPTWSPTARPALVAGVDGRLHLMAIKDAGNLYSRDWSAGVGWGAWVEHDDPDWGTQSGVAATPRDNGDISWVAMKASGSLRGSTGSGSSWGGLGNHGNGWADSALPGIAYANNRLWIFATKSAGQLYHRSWTSGGGWGTWINNGPDWSRNVGPTAITVPSGGLLWVSTKTDSNLRSRRLLGNGSWNGQNSHGTGWVK